MLNNHLPIFLIKYFTIPTCNNCYAPVLISIPSSGYPQGSQDQLDSKRGAQASRNAWSDIRWPQLSWSWQGSPLLANQGRLPPRCLDPSQHTTASPQAIKTRCYNPVTFYLLYFILRWKANGFQ